MPEPAQLLTEVSARRNPMLALLRRLVETESPSDSKQAVDRANELAAAEAERLGGAAKLYKQQEFGDVLELRFGPRRSLRKPVLLLGHLDTVWPLGTLATMPWRESGGKIFGPGVLDMKAGVAMALTAVEVLAAAGVHRPVTVLLNPDEEVGSPVSRPVTERLARAADAVLVLEPAQGLACKTSRKGVGDYRIEVRGVASHAGVDFERGHSAVLELAHQLESVSRFTDQARGRTVNPGVIGGGTRSNVVAAEAWAEVDVRIRRAGDAARVARLFRGLRPRDPGCTVTVTGGMNRPPMERTAGTVRLYRLARTLAAELGFDLPEASTGGGSDGNFTAALGVPTLDGLGAVGEGAHAAHEHIVLEQLVPRTALLAQMLARLP